MSTYAYNQFIQETQDKLSTVLTAAMLENAVIAIREILNGYELDRIIAPDDSTDYLLESYLDAISVEGKSQKTVERYKYVLHRFLRAVGTTSQTITTNHIRKFLADEKARGLADTTIEGFREIFGAYFGWLLREGLIHRNPMGNIGPIKCAKKVKHAYSDVDIERLKMNCLKKKEKAIVCFLLATGCRVSEAVSLDRKDVNLNTMECIVLGKGNKERHVYLDQVAAMAMKEYLDDRTDDEPALFINRCKKRLTTGGVRSILKKLGGLAGVEQVHPHKFRRTRATNLIKHGMPIQEVAIILGHEKLDTTMMYVDIDQADVKNSYRKYA